MQFTKVLLVFLLDTKFYFDSSYRIRKPKTCFDKVQEQKHFDYYLNEFGQNKKLPTGFELPALVALSYYPELRDVEVEFIVKQAKRTSSAKPSPFSVILKGEKRTYEIIVSNDLKDDLKPILLQNLSFNCQIGVIGHELAHISDFLYKNSLEIILDGISYGIDSEKRRMEKKTDTITIEHKLAYQILEYAELIGKLKKQFPEEEYYSTYSDYYLSSEEIKRQIREMPIYQTI